jgi:magnesium transporter
MQFLETVDADAIGALRAREEFFWLDLRSPTDAQLDELGELLRIPRLALDDSKGFGERPKIDDYGRRVLLVFYGAHDEELVEVHMHLSGDEVVTIRRAECAHLGQARDWAKQDVARSEEDLVYRILEALAESLRELTDRRAAEVDGLEDLAYERPTAEERRRMSQLRTRLFRLQQTVVPQRDMLARGAELLEGVPGLEGEVARHPFRDVHDDLVLTANQIAYSREVLSEALNVLVNQMAGRLTTVATIFLPLAFVTGFFGMNFGWMVDHIDSLATFLVFGLAATLATLLIALALLARAGYVGGSRVRRDG